jgi:competence CoiA-like predicted nuclease
MLTCQVGKSIVDTFTYKEEQLREWSNKGMLKCPACGEKMLYCHGDFKIPYFRHEKNSDCPDIYSEGVTQEHIQGIKIIYDWLQIQEGIDNLQLEKWIPETRQRPDIYFTKDGQEYAIEFQCSPIATQYNKRHDLYRLQGINDIWILGIDKYSIKEYEKVLSFELFEVELSNLRFKTIESEITNSDNSLLYLNQNGQLIKTVKKINPICGYKTKYNNIIDSKQLNLCYLTNILQDGNLYNDNSKFKIVSNIVKSKIFELNKEVYEDNYKFNSFVKNDKLQFFIYSYYNGYIYNTNIDNFDENILNECIQNQIINEKEKIIENRKKLKEREEKTNKCQELSQRFKVVNKNCRFTYGQGNYNFYLWKIIFTCDDFDRTFFIKENQTDCTKKLYCYINLDSYNYRELNVDKIFEYISHNISNTLRQERYGR